MKEVKFSLEGNPFIELDKLLKLLRAVESGGAAHQAIDQGRVRRNGETETRRRAKLRTGDTVEFGTLRITIEE